MFITITRSGGPFALRVAAAAIAYIGKMPDGAVLHLISGEHMRVDDEPAEIERLVIEALTPAPAEPALALVEAQLGSILDHLVRHGLGGRELLQPVIDEALEEVAPQPAGNDGGVSGVQPVEKRTEQVRRRGRGHRS
jgi:hypothetical protein